MNNEFRKLLDKYELHPRKITIKNHTKIIESDQGCFVFKKRKRDLKNTYSYLKSRAFDNFPELVRVDNEYDIYEYIPEIDEPIEQKALDIVQMMSMLHSKTTFFKEVDFDDYKEIYEKMIEEQEDCFMYYNHIMDEIESDVYMSPSEYLLARNITNIYKSLELSRTFLEHWYHLIKDKKNMRVVNIHNNIDLSHYLKTNQKSYLISWENNKIDMPIIDIYVFYKRHYLELDFIDLMHIYESRYPLLEEEKYLLFSKILLPDKINFQNAEYERCKNVRKLFDYLYKTFELTENSKPKTTKKQ